MAPFNLAHPVCKGLLVYMKSSSSLSQCSFHYNSLFNKIHSAEFFTNRNQHLLLHAK